MAATRFDGRFFESTRGRMVLLLRGGKLTVNELAASLGLTDNAVRAHLATLERDGLVRAGGTVRGYRKPHTAFQLTSEARHLFPKPYDSLFNTLLSVLKGGFTEKALTAVLRQTGRRLARVNAPPRQSTPDEKMEFAVNLLGELGGAPKVIRENGRTLIKSESCPFADVVAAHPEVCRVAESMIGEVLARPVKELCDRSAYPKCCFIIRGES